MCDRLGVSRDDRRMGETDSTIADGAERFWEIANLLANMQAVGRCRRRHLAVMAQPINRRDRPPVVDARL